MSDLTARQKAEFVLRLYDDLCAATSAKERRELFTEATLSMFEKVGQFDTFSLLAKAEGLSRSSASLLRELLEETQHQT